MESKTAKLELVFSADEDIDALVEIIIPIQNHLREFGLSVLNKDIKPNKVVLDMKKKERQPLFEGNK